MTKKLIANLAAKFTAYLPFILFLSFVVWMVIQADTDQNNLIIEIGHRVPFGDKVGHFSLFGLLALLLNVSLRFKVIDLQIRKFHLGSVLVFCFAIFEEFTQLAFENRTFDLMDMLFDLLGIGLLSSISFRRFIVSKLKSFADLLSQKLLVD